MPSSRARSGDFLLETHAPVGGDRVDPDAASAGRRLPAGLDPAGAEHALKRRVKGPFFHLQQVVRRALDVLDQRVAVARLLPEGLQHHHLQRPWKEVLAAAWLVRARHRAN